MRIARLLLLILIAATAFGPRCAAAMPQAPRMAMAHHQGMAHHPAKNDANPCEAPCIGCAVWPLREEASLSNEPLMALDAPIPPGAPRIDHASALDPPPPRRA